MKLVNSRKYYYILIYIFISLIVLSSSIYNGLVNQGELKSYTGKVVDYDDYERRGEYVYKIKSNTPYTGRVILKEKNKIRSIFEYKNGKQDGVKYTYYLNGKLYIKTNWKDDVKNGERKQWREDGTLYIVSGYKDDKLISMREYNEDGKTISGIFEIDGDRAKVIVYDKKGRVKVAYGEGRIINHETIAIIEDGIVQSFYPNGKIKTDVLMKDGKGNGPLKTYYENGTLQLDTTVEDGKIKGALTFYYPNGNKQLRMDYLEGTSNEDGLINGNVETYNSNGSIQYKGYFDNVKVSMLLKEEYGDIKNNKEFVKLLKRFM